MDMNSVSLAGWASKAGIKEGKYPYGWVRIDLPGFSPLVIAPIPSFSIFLGFVVKTDKDRDKMNKIQQGGWITAWDCSLTSRPAKEEGKESRGLQGSLTRVIISPTKGNGENIALLAGRVEDIFGPNWVRLGCSYMVPNAKEGQPHWKKRFIKMFVPGKHGLTKGKDCYVHGKVSNKTPDGKEDVIVVAETINYIA